MILEIAYYGDPFLRKKVAKINEITDEVKQLAADMIETMHHYNGIGLAANQVKKNLAIFVTCVPSQDDEGNWHNGEDKVYINPKITSYSKEKDHLSEGCLSIPKLYMDVTRPKTITIEALDLDGNKIEAELLGLFARNFMHENDHLNGVLYIDRLDRKEKNKIDPILQQIKKFYYKKK